jgi:hypothetical protein
VQTRRIRGRLIEIDVGEAKGLGWVAVGIVQEGLAPEIGLRFEAKAATEAEAARILESEIEASFA